MAQREKEIEHRVREDEASGGRRSSAVLQRRRRRYATTRGAAEAATAGRDRHREGTLQAEPAKLPGQRHPGVHREPAVARSARRRVRSVAERNLAGQAPVGAPPLSALPVAMCARSLCVPRASGGAGSRHEHHDRGQRISRPQTLTVPGSGSGGGARALARRDRECCRRRGHPAARGRADELPVEEPWLQRWRRRWCRARSSMDPCSPR